MKPLETWFKEQNLHAQAVVILRKYGVAFGEVESTGGPRPKKHIALARHELIRFTKMHFPMWSTPAIGGVFNLDHTTVLAALKKDGADDVYKEDARAEAREVQPSRRDRSTVRTGGREEVRKDRHRPGSKQAKRAR